MNEKVKAAVKKVVPANLIREVRAAINKRYIHDMERADKTEFKQELFPCGINLVGQFSQESGLGQSCRLLAKEIEAAGIPHNFIDIVLYQQQNHSNHSFDGKLSDKYSYGINLYHINMQDFFLAWRRMKPEDRENHYQIAFWLWENEAFPKEWVPMIKQLDEIWTPAEFISRALRKVTDKPVRTIPYTVEAEYKPDYNRSHFNLPENKFLFLMLFDSNSISERKNPEGVIEAFKSAFHEKPHDAGLVIKIGNADQNELNQLKRQLSGYDVYFINGMLEKKEVNSLIKCCDVYVSLHRAEGYGLVLAEAMKLGVPTIATAYSANTEFQTNDTACLVKYKLVRIKHDLYPYHKNTFWAEPDIQDASEAMKKLRYDSKFYKEISDNAYQYMNSEDRMKTSVECLQGYYKEIYENSKRTI